MDANTTTAASTTVALACREQGQGPPLVILHGLFGNAANWGVIAGHLASQARVLALDLRNHGRSPWAEPADYLAMAGDVLAWLDQAGLAEATLLGHSLGGKVAMTVALLAPARVSRLLVVDIAPATYAERHRHLVEAMLSLDLASVPNRATADAALAAAIPEAGLRAFLLTNLQWRGTQAAWRINLPALARALPELRAFPAALTGRQYPGPTLFLAGDRSDYLAAPASDAIPCYFPQARVHWLAGANHWPHRDRPADFLAAAQAFLGQTAPHPFTPER